MTDDYSTEALIPAYEEAFRRNPPRTCAGGASHPAMTRLSDERLRRFHPQLFGLRGTLRALAITFVPGVSGLTYRQIAEWLYHGDSRAAVVVGLRPLVVSAYNDDLDCVALLRFDDSLAAEFGLKVGSRLIAANTFRPRKPLVRLARDLWDGPHSQGVHANVWPLIADFLSDDLARIEQRKREIDESEWQRAFTLGHDRLRQGAPLRDGRPLTCGRPA